MAIARNMAVNLGLKHRNELKRRNRWALDQAESIQSSPLKNLEEDPISPDMLRQTLADLPPKHRECLVLFYLEGKSIAQAAQATGISETAFKTRLFRARKVLRNCLETQLGESLSQLRPNHAIAPVIMGILATQKAQAACAVGSAAGAGVTKSFLKCLMVNPILTGLVSSVLYHFWRGRAELKNFRHQEGFRAQIYKQNFNESFFLVPLRIICVLFCMSIAYTISGGDTRILCLLGLLGLPYVIASLRQLRFNRSRFIIFNICAFALLSATYWANGFLDQSSSLFPFGLALFCIFMGLSYRYQPRRMDYNLFLRLAKDMIPEPENMDLRTNPPSRNELLAFARFLSERWLVVYVRERKQGLQLRMPSINTSTRNLEFSPFFWLNGSSITMSRDGGMRATLGNRDQTRLVDFCDNSLPTREAHESRVAQAVQQAFYAFLAGDTRRAELDLGQQSEEEIFHITPERSKAVQAHRYVMIGLGLFMVILATYSLLRDTYFYPTQGRGLKAVQITEGQVRAALAQLDSPPGPTPARPSWETNETDIQSPQTAKIIPAPESLPSWKAFDNALCFKCLVLPSKVWFSTQARDNIRQFLSEQVLSNGMWTSEDPERMMTSLFYRLPRSIHTAIPNGLFTLSDLAELGLTPKITRDYLTANPGITDRWTTIEETSKVILNDVKQEYTHLDVERLVAHLPLLRLLNCTDLLNAPRLIDQLRAHQVIAGNTLEGRKPIPDRKLVYGLFHSTGWSPLRDTYQALVILSAIDGLDHIDRAACTEGILRFHHGKGLFGSFKKNDGLHFSGDTHDTLYAYESLRLLGSLNQVKDLHKWVFRPLRGPRIAGQDSTQQITWSEIEAWILTQRLKHFISNRHQNPQLKPPSLLEPH